MSDPGHVRVSTRFDERVARRLALLLQDEQVPVQIAPHPPRAWGSWVCREHRARAAARLDAASPSGSELDDLATGARRRAATSRDQGQVRGSGTSPLARWRGARVDPCRQQRR